MAEDLRDYLLAVAATYLGLIAVLVGVDVGSSLGGSVQLVLPLVVVIAVVTLPFVIRTRSP